MAERRVVQVVPSQEIMEGAGVRVRRTIGTPAIEDLDPFLLLDEFKSDEPQDYLAGFPDHPHRGFETVTYVLAGSMEHRDHKGNQGVIGAGGAQWMTAGRGIIHSEMPKQEKGLMWGFQLWVNLPAAEKMGPPRYQDVAPESIPEAAPGVRVVAGSFGGTTGPVEGIATAPLYLDVRGSFEGEVAAGHAAFCYVYDGEARIGETPVAAGTLAVLSDGDRVAVKAASEARFLLVAARPIGEPIARSGPFVMNTVEEIRRAFKDFREGKLTD